MARTRTLILILLGAMGASCTSSPPRVAPGGSGGGASANAQGLSPAEAAAWTKVQAKVEKLNRQGPPAADKPQEAIEFFMAQRLAPGMTDYPIAQVQGAIAQTRAREAPRSAGAGGIESWHALGPGNIGGRTRALAIDPTNPSVMYAGGVSGGVWKTTDGGASWTPTDDFMVNLAVTSIVIDPTDPSVLYAGTGEGFFAQSMVRGLGIFKSVDAGATWTQLAATSNSNFHYVNKLAISPNNPSRIYAATRTGVWRSTNGGTTWSVMLRNPQYLAGSPASNGSPAGCTDLAIRTDTSPDTIFASFGVFYADGVFRSTNNGQSWTQLGTALDIIHPNQGRTSIGIAPSNQNVIYLAMASNYNGSLGQLVDVFRSTDGGNTWSGRVDMGTKMGPWLFSNLVLATGCAGGYPPYSQGWYDNALGVDPVNPDVLWVGGIDLFRSDDGGRNWGVTEYWHYEPGNSRYVHADKHTIVFHPGYDGAANQTMYVLCDGGIHRTNNARAATSQEDCPFPANQPLPQVQWVDLNNGYGVTQFYHGDSSPSTDLFIAGAQDNGTSLVRSRDGHDDWERAFGGDGGYVAVDHQDPDVLYVEIQFFPEIRKSTDGGQSFDLAVSGITDTDGLFITPFAMDPSDPGVLWTGGSRPWRTTNGASSWSVAGSNFFNAGTISAIAISPSNPNVVYMGFHDGRVARSTNARSPSPSWTVFSASHGLVNGAWVSSVAVDPEFPDIAYCTYSTFGVPHVFRTINGGQSWTSLGGPAMDGIPDIPVHWIAVRPCGHDQLYLGTEIGVFATDDGGATWSPANAGLANTVVETVDVKDADTLVAFTHGRGAFVADLEPCPCPIDFSGDGILNTDDFIAYLAAYAAGDARADVTAFGSAGNFCGANDGAVSSDDFICFLALYGAGCP